MDQDQRAAIAAMLEPDLKPYRNRYPAHRRLPPQGLDRTAVLADLTALAEAERPRWEDGFASGAVYHGGREHIDFLNQVYALFSQGNPLHPDLWPSITKFEAEVVAMTSAMLHGADLEPPACGTVTSGGTESILLAMRTYRDHARAAHGITEPEIVAPVTAHAAFDKAAQYFGLRLVKVGVGGDLRADPTDRTVAVVGSAVQFPHGVADSIEELAAIAAEHGVGFHTDSCLGGFVLPWAERLGYPVAPFDFRVPGVTSMSCDTHKFGYAAKGTSVLLWRDAELRERQYYATTDWPGGLYYSPTFAAEDVNIYDVLDRMTGRGWSLNGLQRPAAVHLCVTLRHTAPEVAQRFLDDLRTCVAQAREDPGGGLMTPVYGMAAVPETRGDVDDLLRTYCDVLYRV